jgi:K+-transporting ATPase ATPase C chain
MTLTEKIAETTAGPPQPPLVALARSAAGMLVVLTLLTGVAYPLLVMGVARAAFAERASGSLVTEHGRVVGSRLIGQSFEDPKHFWGRLSATGPTAYDGAASAGSNLGPTNAALTKAAAMRIAALRAADPGNPALVPVDLVTASASGLDPHISPAAAEYQVGRVARERGLSEARVRALVRASTEDRALSVLGEPGVNVLVLNLALDRQR